MTWWWILQLRSKKKKRRIFAATKLGASRTPRAARALLSALKRNLLDYSLEKTVEESLTQIGPPGVGPMIALCRRKKSTSTTFQKKADACKYNPYALRALVSNHWYLLRVQTVAIRALGRIGNDMAVSPLLDILAEPPRLLDWHVESLRKYKTFSINGEGALCESLTSEESYRRRETINALTAFSDERIILAFIDLLNHPDGKVVREAASGLCKLRSPSVATALAAKCTSTYDGNLRLFIVDQMLLNDMPEALNIIHQLLHKYGNDVHVHCYLANKMLERDIPDADLTMAQALEHCVSVGHPLAQHREPLLKLLRKCPQRLSDPVLNVAKELEDGKYYVEEYDESTFWSDAWYRDHKPDYVEKTISNADVRDLATAELNARSLRKASDA